MVNENIKRLQKCISGLIERLPYVLPQKLVSLSNLLFKKGDNLTLLKLYDLARKYWEEPIFQQLAALFYTASRCKTQISQQEFMLFLSLSVGSPRRKQFLQQDCIEYFKILAKIIYQINYQLNQIKVKFLKPTSIIQLYNTLSQDRIVNYEDFHRIIRKTNKSIQIGQTRAFISLFISQTYQPKFAFYQLKDLFDRPQKQFCDQRIKQLILIQRSFKKKYDTTAATASTVHQPRPADLISVFFSNLQQLQILKQKLSLRSDFSLPDAFHTFDVQGTAILQHQDLSAGLQAISADIDAQQQLCLYEYLRGQKIQISYQRFSLVLLPSSKKHQQQLLNRPLPQDKPFQGYNSFNKQTKRIFRQLIQKIAYVSRLKMQAKQCMIVIPQEEVSYQVMQMLDKQTFF